MRTWSFTGSVFPSQGQFTEKRVYLNSKLPTWVSSWVPAIFYVTEKAWNYYPYTITEYSCSFLPRFSVSIETRFEVTGSSLTALGPGGLRRYRSHSPAFILSILPSSSSSFSHSPFLLSLFFCFFLSLLS